LEPIIKEARDQRLRLARDARIEARKRLAEEVYKGYKKTLVPAQWRLLPGLYEVLQLPAFNTVVYAPDDIDVELTRFEEAQNALPGFVVAWAASRKVELVRLINLSHSSSDIQAEPTSTVANIQSLELATTVFACRNLIGLWQRCKSENVALIGWEGAAGHHCSSHTFGSSGHYLNLSGSSTETLVDFSKRGSAAAASLVALAGLNASEATAAEMDTLDLRFLCLACPARFAPGNKQTFDSFSWRTAVSNSQRQTRAE
jgi:hypothetical protein